MRRYGSSIEVILLLARVKPSDECIEKANALLGRGVDWKTLYRISLINGVAPLIYGNLSLLRGVPGDIEELFRTNYLSNAGDVIRTSAGLKEITGALGKGGVKSIALKGHVTAEEIYGDAALYPSSDIDLLIRMEDVPRALEIMEKIGYRPEHGPDPFLVDRYGGLNFFRQGAKGVDLHVRLGNRRYFDIPEDFWWEDLRIRTYEGNSYSVLSYERMLFFAALHLFEHGCAPFKFIAGIAEILRTHGKDIRWKVLFEDAGRFNTGRCILLSLDLASTLLDAPLPAIVGDMLERRSRKEWWITRKIEEGVFREKTALAPVMFLLTLLQYNASQVVCRMAKWLLPSLKEVAYRYDLPQGSRKVFFYYLLNPVLLLLKRREG